MYKFNCPNCRKAFSAKEDAAGRRTKCPKCSTPFRIPVLEVSTADIVTPLAGVLEPQDSQENILVTTADPYEMSHENNPAKQATETSKAQSGFKKIFKYKKTICFFLFIFLLLPAIQTVRDQRAPPEDQYERAITPFKEGNYDRAIFHLTNVINKDPDFKGKDGTAISLRALAFYKSKKYQEAIVDFTEAIEMEPQKMNFFYFRGNAFMEIGKFQEAIEDHTIAINLSETDFLKSGGYLARGKAYAAKKKYWQAIADYDKADQLYPANDAQKLIGAWGAEKLRKEAYEKMGKQP